MLVRLFERRIEIRDLRTQALLRTHTRVDRPGTVVLPMAERVFNPSRETRFILAQARAIGAQASRLCQMLFGIGARRAQLPPRQGAHRAVGDRRSGRPAGRYPDTVGVDAHAAARAQWASVTA